MLTAIWRDVTDTYEYSFSVAGDVMTQRRVVVQRGGGGGGGVQAVKEMNVSSRSAPILSSYTCSKLVRLRIDGATGRDDDGKGVVVDISDDDEVHMLVHAHEGWYVV